MSTTKDLRFAVSGSEEVSAIFARPSQADSLFVLAHGAGAGMHQPFLEAMSHELAIVGVATFRYQFPYMENGVECRM